MRGKEALNMERKNNYWTTGEIRALEIELRNNGNRLTMSPPSRSVARIMRRHSRRCVEFYAAKLRRSAKGGNE